MYNQLHLKLLHWQLKHELIPIWLQMHAKIRSLFSTPIHPSSCSIITASQRSCFFLPFFSRMVFGLMHVVSPIHAMVMVELCPQLTRLLHHYWSRWCDYSITAALFKCLPHFETIAQALHYAFLADITSDSKSALTDAKEAYSAALPALLLLAVSYCTVFVMNANLPWDDCDQRIQ